MTFFFIIFMIKGSFEQKNFCLLWKLFFCAETWTWRHCQCTFLITRTLRFCDFQFFLQTGMQRFLILWSNTNTKYFCCPVLRKGTLFAKQHKENFICFPNKTICLHKHQFWTWMYDEQKPSNLYKDYNIPTHIKPGWQQGLHMELISHFHVPFWPGHILVYLFNFCPSLCSS